MDPSKMTTQELLMYGAIINGGIGLLLGLVPLILGFIKGKVKFGVIGLAGSIVGGLLLGILLSLPIAAVATWLVIRGPKP